jgi:putative nucleotidyltransferase with HDIG domain
MRSSDDTIYTHSLNVAMIARIIGKWLKWSREDLDQLVIAGLLHDIGKILIPPEVLNKEGRLTDEEFALIKSHAQKGYDLIKDTNLDPRVKKAALMHHERCDGSGYPMHLQEILIEDFAMIIAIADVYDAMTATRKHRSAMCPFQVIAEFESDGLQKYKPEYILTFLRKMAVTYQNNQVVLNDGRSGKIILLNQNSLSKPLIQMNDGSCIDLAKSNLFIQSII